MVDGCLFGEHHKDFEEKASYIAAFTTTVATPTTTEELVSATGEIHSLSIHSFTWFARVCTAVSQDLCLQVSVRSVSPVSH